MKVFIPNNLSKSSSYYNSPVLTPGKVAVIIVTFALFGIIGVFQFKESVLYGVITFVFGFIVVISLARVILGEGKYRKLMYELEANNNKSSSDIANIDTIDGGIITYSAKSTSDKLIGKYSRVIRIHGVSKIGRDDSSYDREQEFFRRILSALAKEKYTMTMFDTIETMDLPKNVLYMYDRTKEMNPNQSKLMKAHVNVLANRAAKHKKVDVIYIQVFASAVDRLKELERVVGGINQDGVREAKVLFDKADILEYIYNWSLVRFVEKEKHSKLKYRPKILRAFDEDGYEVLFEENINEVVNESEIKHEKTKNKKGSVSAFHFYKELAKFYLLNTYQDTGKATAGRILFTYSDIITKYGIKRVLFIDRPKSDVDQYLLAKIKTDLSGYGSVRYFWNIEPKPMTSESGNISRQMKMAQYNYESADKDQSLSSQAFKTGKERESYNRLMRSTRSFKWFHDSEETGDEFFESRLCVEVVASNLKNLNIMERHVTGALKTYFQVSKRFLNSLNYISEYGPLSAVRGNLTKTHVAFSSSDRLISKFCNLHKCKVGGDQGACIGYDVITNIPITLDLNNISGSKVFLTGAMAGGGKSATMKYFMNFLQLAGIPSITIDYEGVDYLRMGKALDALFIGFGSKSVYYDPVPLSKLSPTAYNDSVSMILKVFKFITGGLGHREVGIMNETINAVYSAAGVDKRRPETWIKSESLSIHDLYRYIKSNRSRDEHFDLLYTKIMVFFDDNIYSDTFKNKINIDEIVSKDTGRIIFTYGSKGKSNVDTGDDSIEMLKQLFISFITNELCWYNKRRGLKTVVIVEELQRYINRPFTAMIINDFATGGRKLDMVPVFVTNNPTLFKGNANQDIAKYLEAAANNTNGFLLGKLSSPALKGVDEIYDDLAFSMSDLHRIRTNENGAFKHCFLMCFNGEYAIVKADLPKEYVDLYQTEGNVDDSLESIEG